MNKKHQKGRFIEVGMGLIFLFMVTGLLFSIALNIEFMFENNSPEEDLIYIGENLDLLKLSSILWIITGSITLLAVPFYLVVFHRFQKFMHIPNALFLLVMAYAFFRVGLLYNEILQITTPMDISAIDLLNPDVLLTFSLIRTATFHYTMGMSAFGAILMIMGISKFRDVKFPVVGSIFIFFGGPVIFAFSLINSDSILFTGGIAIASIGLIIIGAWLLNSGLYKR